MHGGDWTTQAPVVRGFAVREPTGDIEGVARTVQDCNDVEAHRLAWQHMLATVDHEGTSAYP